VFWEKRKFLAPTGILTPDRPFRNLVALVITVPHQHANMLNFRAMFFQGSKAMLINMLVNMTFDHSTARFRNDCANRDSLETVKTVVTVTGW
jgi:hypothetical protein